MLILGIDTATDQVSVAIGGHEGVLGSVAVARGRRHAETLTPSIEFLAAQTGVGLDEIGVVAMAGPGVFGGYMMDKHNRGAFLEPGWVLKLPAHQVKDAPAHQYGVQAGDTLSVAMAANEVDHTLRRMQDDLDATHRAVLAETARYKADRGSVSVRERYLRILTLMDQYVHPLVEIVRVDGLLEGTLAETDMVLRAAREQGVYTELGMVERNERRIRVMRRHAIHTLNESRKELQPL